MECHGVPEYVIVSGRVCVDDGELRVAQGHGRFVETPTFAPFVYDIENAEKLKPEVKIDNGVDMSYVDHRVHKLSIDEQQPMSPTLPESAVGTPSCKGHRMEGQRNLQDSTFSISGEFYFIYNIGGFKFLILFTIIMNRISMMSLCCGLPQTFSKNIEQC